MSLAPRLLPPAPAPDARRRPPRAAARSAPTALTTPAPEFRGFAEADVRAALEVLAADPGRAAGAVAGRIVAAVGQVAGAAAARRLYRNDPVAFGREVLGVTFTSKQLKMLAAVLVPPHRLMIKSANNIGKSWFAAFLCVWFYCTRDPCSVLLTAMTFSQVVDVTFKEVRKLYGDRPGILPKAPRIEDHPGHLMSGFTAGSDTAFQGRREASNLLIFEECMGIGPSFWTAARFMLSGGESFWVAICNPTDSASHAHAEELSGQWTMMSVSAFEHPNILAELAGDPPPIPAAVRLGSLKENLANYGLWIGAEEATPLDVDTWDPATYDCDPAAGFPPGAAAGARFHFPARYWRALPIGEARILGRYPSESAASVFSEAAFALAARLAAPAAHTDEIVGGCDVARFGDDDTEIVFRRGARVLERHVFHGQDTAATAGQLKAACRRLGKKWQVDPYTIRVNVDDTGVGGAVVDMRRDDEHGGRPFRFVPVNNASTAVEPLKYPNVRSELLFTLAEQLAEGAISLRDLPAADRLELRRQGLGITYRMDARGRRVVESKDEIKRRLGHSPDALDALALCCYTAAGTGGIVGAVSPRGRVGAAPGSGSRLAAASAVVLAGPTGATGAVARADDDDGVADESSYAGDAADETSAPAPMQADDGLVIEIASSALTPPGGADRTRALDRLRAKLAAGRGNGSGPPGQIDPS